MSLRHTFLLCSTLLLTSVIALPANASIEAKQIKIAGVEVDYKVVLPNDYDASKNYPAILAFGGGPQTMNTVDSMLSRNLQAEAERRGYIVIAPAAPNGDLFFEDGARIFPAFLDAMLKGYAIADNKFHIAGVSNGGIAAFHIAAANPTYFLSVTAFPGYLWQPTEAKLLAISKLCAYYYVGENDEYRWHAEMQREVEFLTAQGAVAKYSEEKGQPHRIESLAGANASRLFDGFDAVKAGCNRK
jgi:predicted esterase